MKELPICGGCDADAASISVSDAGRRGGQARARSLTPAQRSAAAAHAAHASAASLSPAQRKQRARQAAAARWAQPDVDPVEED